MAPEKDPWTLVEAAARDGALHVVTAGSGPLDEAVARRAAERIPGRYTALGFVNQSGLPSIYACADLAVLPSRFEPWGLVVNEALASGCPVAASERAGAAHDLVPEAYRFRPGDPDDLLRAVTAWRGDAPARRDPVSWARGRVERFSFAEDARGLREACEALARRRDRAVR
jgi:glycosyltransferase involved in cell wall biosynthesis